MPEEITPIIPKPMTRAEKIKIRAERVRKRRIRLGLPPLADNTTNTDSTVTTAVIDAPKVTIPKEKLTLEICIHCYMYQRRLTFMLNSICQQEGDIPSLIINISHCPEDGMPTTGDVIKFFRDRGLNIVETLVTKEEVHNRGRARNRQTHESKADYLLYVDCDMVYDKDFFADLHKQLKTNLKDETKVMGADRISLKEDFCVKYFNENDKREYPCIIENVAEIVASWPVKWVTGRGVAAGNFQLCSMMAIKAKGGGYGGRNNDFWRNTKSDRAMRCRMGGRTPIEVKKQWHLNHGRALGEQR
jgi:hypothetical protein